MEIQVNLVGVLLATLSSMVVGSIWYSKAVFGKTWMKLAKITDQEMKERSTAPMVFMVFRAVSAAIVLSTFAYIYNSFFQNSFLSDTLMVGFWAALLVVPTMVMHDLFEGRRKKLSLINGMHEFVTIMVMALVIGVVGV